MSGTVFHAASERRLPTAYAKPLVDRMLELSRKKAAEKNPDLSRQVEAQLALTDRRIDMFVYGVVHRHVDARPAESGAAPTRRRTELMLIKTRNRFRDTRKR